MKFINKLWGSILIAFILCSSVVLTVQAHATLVRSDPADNSIVSSPPGTISLWFSEKIDEKLSSVQVWDSTNQLVQPVTIRVDPSAPDLMEIQIPQINNGIYSVNWKAFSADDGHLTRGLLVFGVGSGTTLISSAAAKTDPLPDPQNALITWLNYLSLLGLIGGIAIAMLIFSAGSDRSREQSTNQLLISSGTLDRYSIDALRVAASQRLFKWLRTLTLIAFLVGIGMLMLQIVAIRNPSLPLFASLTSSFSLIFQSRWGVLWISRQVTLSLFIPFISLMIAREERSGRLIASHHAGFSSLSTFFYSKRIFSIALIFLSVSLVSIQALNSHAASLDNLPYLAIGVDAIHLLAASFWVGGLAGMAISLFPLIRHDRADLSVLIRATWGKFSRVAAFSVGLVATTGLYSLGQQVVSIDALITTTYGRGLLIKTGIFIACGCFGLLNSILLHPKLASPFARLFHRPAGWTPLSIRRRPFLVISELSLGIMLIAMAAIVTNSTPAHGPQFIASEDIPSTVTSVADDLWVTFFAKPNQPGQNVLTIEVDNSIRPAPAPIQQVFVSVSSGSQKGASGPLAATQIDTNLYQVSGDYLDQMGNWQVSVTVIRQGFPAAITLLSWTVAPPGGPRPLIISDQPLYLVLTPLSASMFLLLVIIFIATWPKKLKALAPVPDLSRPNSNKSKETALTDSVKSPGGIE